MVPPRDAAHLEWALSDWILTTRPRRDHEAVALDGKVVCGAGETVARAPQRWTEMTTVERQRGRREERRLRVTTDLNAHIMGFPAVGQVLRVTRLVRDKRGGHGDRAR